MLETVQTELYHLSQMANTLVVNQLSHLTLASVGIILLAGLSTSLTPCMLSMLPITVAYFGGYDQQSRTQSVLNSLWFALGLATTLAGLGVGAALLGKIYGQVGEGLPIVISLVAILMGLNLLEILPLRLPAWGGIEWIGKEWPTGVRSYLLGLTFGLVASPCSTPVLATLLAWISSTQDPILGSALLLSYTVGYVAPLVVAGSFTASIKRLLELRRWSGWITPTSGAILIGFGLFSVLSRVFAPGI